MKELESLAKKTYPRESGKILLDIDLDTYADIYEEWDYSPQKRRDIDEDLFNYLMECSGEIPAKESLVIRFHLPSDICNEKREDNALKGLNRYLVYKYQKNKYLRKKAYRQLLGYGLSGLVFLVMGFILRSILKSHPIAVILHEGLIIGGWVLFWECFSILFFKDAYLRETQRHVGRLLKSKVRFAYHQPGSKIQ